MYSAHSITVSHRRYNSLGPFPSVYCNPQHQAGQVDQGGHTIELDVQRYNLALDTVWMPAQDRSKWCQLVETAMLTDQGTLLNDDDSISWF